MQHFQSQLLCSSLRQLVLDGGGGLAGVSSSVCVCVAMFRRRNRRSTAMSQQTIKEGQLYKRGKLNTEWRQRLFILNSKQLTYFKGGKHAPSGIIELKEVRGVSDILQDGTFRIETPVRVFEIRGDTKEEGVGWIESIREARRSCMQELP